MLSEHTLFDNGSRMCQIKLEINLMLEMPQMGYITRIICLIDENSDKLQFKNEISLKPLTVYQPLEHVSIFLLYLRRIWAIYLGNSSFSPSCPSFSVIKFCYNFATECGILYCSSKDSICKIQ